MSATRYPLYAEGSDEVTAWIDEYLRLRDTNGRFIPMSREMRHAHLTSCLVVAYGRKDAASLHTEATQQENRRE